MRKMGRIIDLDNETRRLYCQFDYRFFLNNHLEESDYSKEDIDEIERGYRETKKKLLNNLKINKKQNISFIDGAIRKMHSGGALPTRFKLDESRSSHLLDFYAEGEIMAYFEIWKKYELRKIFKRNFWDITIKLGAILGFVLTVIKIIEVFNN